MALVVLPAHVEGRAIAGQRRVLLRAVTAAPRVEVDCRNVSSLSSAGLAVLVHALRTARRLGTELRLVEVNATVSDAVRRHRLDDVFLFEVGAAA